MKGEVSISNWYLGDPKQTQLRTALRGPRVHLSSTHSTPVYIRVYTRTDCSSTANPPSPDLIRENEVDWLATLAKTFE